METEKDESTEICLSTSLTKQFPELKSIVSLVTCSICYGVVKEPLTTSVDGCGHTFCSICVRGYLAKFKQQCPQCLKEIHDRDLLINRPLKAIAQYIQTFVPKLEALVQRPKAGEHFDVKQDERQTFVIASHCRSNATEEAHSEASRYESFKSVQYMQLSGITVYYYSPNIKKITLYAPTLVSAVQRIDCF